MFALRDGFCEHFRTSITAVDVFLFSFGSARIDCGREEGGLRARNDGGSLLIFLPEYCDGFTMLGTYSDKF